MATFKTKYDIGDLVYLSTDELQEKWIIKSIRIFPGGLVHYLLATGATEYWAFEIEMSLEENPEFRMGL